MKLNCVIDRATTLKKGMTITLRLDDDAKKEALKNIANFDDKPLVVDFRVNEPKQAEMLNMISPEQRRKIYALFNDIANQTGDNKESVKVNMKYIFLQAYTQHEDFSLSDCSSELSSDFIEFLVSWCFINAVELKEHPKEILDDIEAYMYLCIRYSRCSVCGKEANTITDSRGSISLCETHEGEFISKGHERFKQKYHVDLLREQV